MRAKIRFVKFERGLAMQILEMDEAFRSTGSSKSYTCSNGFRIVSAGFPDLEEKNIYLRGANERRDYIIPYIVFNTNEERDTYLNRAIFALKSWADNWFTEIEKEMVTDSDIFIF